MARDNVVRARESVERLRFGSLQGNSLHTAVSEQARAFTSQTGVPVLMEFPPVVLDTACEAELFAIVIEALTNVRRHARAKQVSIKLTATAKTVTSRIHDDGVGFSPAKTGKHFGVSGMRERAHELGGTFSIRRTQPVGTTITVRAPRR